MKNTLFGLLAFLLISCQTSQNQSVFQVNVNQTLQALVADEDTDHDKKITVDDDGDKQFTFQSLNDKNITLTSTYFLSNLLQKLAEAQENGKTTVKIDLAQIKEKPADRISRLIRTKYWDHLTRTIDQSGWQEILKDKKSNKDQLKRIYVPSTDTIAISYFQSLEDEFKNLKVVILPKKLTPEYVKSINDQPGILSLKIKNNKGKPFVVPGGRFNEMYGWDSYFESIGLNLDGRQDLSQAMIENFAYEIKHYGKILNANRSYYLTRSQPPFFTSFIREAYRNSTNLDKPWLKKMLHAAMQEYFDVWMQSGKKLTKNGLNRYYAQGIGIPPETEEGHYDKFFTKIADSLKTSKNELISNYQSGKLNSKKLDDYFLHDRSMRESGHDTSWRLVGVCAHLNTVALNSLLYKYETDFAYLIKNYLGNSFAYQETTYSAEDWLAQSEKRKKLMKQFLWNDAQKMFYDYNFVKKKQRRYATATNYYPLWANLATPQQAEHLKNQLFATMKAKGGILASAKSSVERFATSNVDRQWDYPYGWAPHQMLIWKGLLNYGYKNEVQELVYRWLWMITKNAVDYNGTIPEKFNLVKRTHKVYAEYGNVGTDFNYITPEGFGWMNASYQYGLSLLSNELRKNLNQLKKPDAIFEKSK